MIYWRKPLPEKVEKLYQVVWDMLVEGVDLYSVKVIDISNRAGIGKGTIYEYFDNKEELIASAMCYCVSFHIEKFQPVLEQISSFEEQFHAVMDYVEEQLKQRVGFFYFMHYFIGTSQIGILMRHKICEEGTENPQSPLPAALIRRMVAKAKERGEIDSSLPDQFCLLEVMGKIICYMTFLWQEKNRELPAGQMKKFLSDSLMLELAGRFCE